MDSILVSAPGKVILHGEHSVVHGKTAVAAAVDIRTYLLCQRLDKETVTLKSDSSNIDVTWKIDTLRKALEKYQLEIKENSKFEASSLFDVKDFLFDLKLLALLTVDHESTPAVLAFLYMYSSIAVYKQHFLPVHITISTNLDVGAGLGSSASFCVCIAAALLESFNLISSSKDSNSPTPYTHDAKELINSLAFQGERILHGRPSGIDNSVITFGGGLSYCGGCVTPLPWLTQVPILLCNTCISRSTKSEVAKVTNKLNQFPLVIQPLMEALDEIAKDSINLLRQQSTCFSVEVFHRHEKLIELNHHILCALGVGHSSLDNIVSITRKLGLYTKLTGAGNGGCTMTLLSPDFLSNPILDDLDAQLQSHGYRTWRAKFGSEGVRRHSSNDQDVPLSILEEIKTTINL